MTKKKSESRKKYKKKSPSKALLLELLDLASFKPDIPQKVKDASLSFLLKNTVFLDEEGNIDLPLIPRTNREMRNLARLLFDSLIRIYFPQLVEYVLRHVFHWPAFSHFHLIPTPPLKSMVHSPWSRRLSYVLRKKAGLECPEESNEENLEKAPTEDEWREYEQLKAFTDRFYARDYLAYTKDDLEHMEAYWDEIKSAFGPDARSEARILMGFAHRCLKMAIPQAEKDMLHTEDKYAQLQKGEENEQNHDTAPQDLDVNSQERKLLHRASELIWEETEDGSFVYGDTSLGIVGTAKKGTVLWAVLHVFKEQAFEHYLSIPDLAKAVDMVLAKYNQLAETKGLLGGAEHTVSEIAEEKSGFQFRSHLRPGKKPIYSDLEPKDIVQRIQAVLRRDSNEERKRWRDRWIHWRKGYVVFGICD